MDFSWIRKVFLRVTGIKRSVGLEWWRKGSFSLSVFWELAGSQKEWLEKQDHRSKLLPNMALKGINKRDQWSSQGQPEWPCYKYLLFLPASKPWPCFRSSAQFSSVTQSCPTLCNPMNGSTPGLPVHHQLLEFTQTHVRRVGDAIQPSHPLSSPSPPAPNPSQHQGLFQWVNSSHEVAKVLEFQLQHQSFQWTPKTDLL